jgi:hypothetical protein
MLNRYILAWLFPLLRDWFSQVFLMAYHMDVYWLQLFSMCRATSSRTAKGKLPVGRLRLLEVLEAVVLSTRRLSVYSWKLQDSLTGIH